MPFYHTLLAKYFSKRANYVLNKQSKAKLLLANFNIKNPAHETMQVLLNNGFTAPKKFQSNQTNVIKTLHFDQIAFKSDEKLISFINTEYIDPQNANAGVVKVMKSVFQDTYQMSDHNLMWVRIKTKDSIKHLMQQ